LANGNEWFCSACNEKRRVYKIAHLYKANKYLFIQIKRFKQGADGKFYKNYSKVSHPLELDLHRILENPTLPEAYFKEVGED
jgi:ubiquitin C-terminal hydrolase